MHHRTALFSTLLLGLAFLLCSPVQAAAAVLANGSYCIKMEGSQLQLAPNGYRQHARVVLAPASPHQVWKFTHLGNDVYRISYKNLELDSQESKIYNGVPIIIWPWHGAGNQRWIVRRAGSAYTLTSVHTKLAVDLKGNKRQTGTVFQGYQKNGADSQRFDIVPCGSNAAPQKEPPVQEEEKKEEEWSTFHSK